MLRRLPAVVLFATALLAQVAPPPAQAPSARPAPAPARALTGRVEEHGGLKLLRLWGAPQDRGYSHGFLLAGEVARVGIAEFEARFGAQPAMLQLARDAVGRLIVYPEAIQQELDGLFAGLTDSGVDLRMAKLGRAFDRTDLAVANALDVFGLMGCSGFTLWGDQVEGGGVLTARNFDWPFLGPHLLDGTILCVVHEPDGRAVASVTWPGYVATVTGVSRDGVAAFLHVGSAKVSMTPEPESWPTAVAARVILERVRPADGARAFDLCKELLENTSPPAGFLTRVVLPTVPEGGAPARVFETDRDRSVPGASDGRSEITTNHFLTRQDGRKASKDSLNRTTKVQDTIAGCLADGAHTLTVAEAWQVLAAVERGGKRFGTLHALVFRNEPWHFELRLGSAGESGCVPAPSGPLRYVLTREQLFPAQVPGAK